MGGPFRAVFPRVFLVAVLVTGVGLFGSPIRTGMISSTDGAPTLRPVTPTQDTTLVEGPVCFSWRFEAESPDVMQTVRHFEVAFWSESTAFSRTFKVIPESSEGDAELCFEECRRIFHRHGVYRWRVMAQMMNGGRLVSEPREFVVKVTVSHEEFLPWLYPYAVQFWHVDRFGSPEYDAFLSGLSSSMPLDDFFSLGLVFHQNLLGLRTMELEERLLILSYVGLGVNMSMRFRAFWNLYVSMYPLADVEYHWFSTGLEEYTSSLYSVKVGGDWMIMPKGTLTVRSCWVPVYRIRYAWSDNELRTWQGRGWELGARLVIPHHVIEPFTILGMEIDFRRIPLEFHYSRIRDHYSGTLMRMGRFSVGYLLW